MQDFKCLKNQRIFHDLNFTAMGWALPASIGASTENKRRNILCIVGDGSLMNNLQEMSLINKFCKNFKLFIINNKGYAMVQQTEDEWLKGNHYGTSNKDLIFPNFELISKANNLNYSAIKSTNELRNIKKILNSSRNHVCEIFISPNKQVVPQVKFGYPIEDSHPLLDENIIKDNMIIKTIKR